MEKATDKQLKFMKSLNLPIYDGISKQSAKEMIAAKLDEQEEEKPEVVKIGASKETKPYTNGAMYVSYAKDLIISGIKPEEAIVIVKKLKEAFE